MTENKIVHIVDDEDSIRRSTSFLLKTSGFEVATYESGVEFLKSLSQAKTGCILLDVRMPVMDGLEVQTKLQDKGCSMPVIILTGHGDISLAVKAMKSGAVDFIEKPFSNDMLLAAIEAAFARLDNIEQHSVRASDAKIQLAGLTARERDVLDGLVQGLPNKSIAYDLGISPRTVEVHRAHLMTKLEASSLSDLLRIAFAAEAEREPLPEPQNISVGKQ